MKVDFGEWMPDQPDLQNSAVEAKNVYSYGNRYRPMPSVEYFSDALEDRCVGAFSTTIIDDTQRTYAATGDSIFELDGFSWSDKSGTTYTVSDPSRWSFTQFGENVLAANYANTLQYVNFVSGGNFANVTSGPKARYIANVRDFVMVGNVDDASDGDVPHRVQWSAIGDPLDWPAAGTDDAFAKQSDYQDLDAEDGPVVSIAGFEFGLIFQERSITRATYVGSPLVFQFDKIDATHGALTDGSVVREGGTVYFLSSNGFYATDGSGEAVPIGHGKVDEYFFDDLNIRRKDEIQSISDPKRKLVIWSYPSNDAGDYPDRCLIYSVVDQRWTRAEITIGLMVQAQTEGYTLDELDSLADLDDLGISLDSDFWLPGSDSAFVFGSNDKMGALTGTALDALLETGEIGLDGRRAYLSGVRPLVEGTAATITVKHGSRNLMNADVNWSSDRSITADTGKADFRKSAFFHRFRVAITGGFDDALGVDAFIQQDDAGR